MVLDSVHVNLTRNLVTHSVPHHEINVAQQLLPLLQNFPTVTMGPSNSQTGKVLVMVSSSLFQRHRSFVAMIQFVSARCLEVWITARFGVDPVRVVQ